MATSPTDWAAFIGAAAWSIPFISWIRAKFEKPIVVPIVGNQIQLGYDSFGPSLGITIALTSKYKDAIVDKINIDVLHENGRKIPLVWKTSYENPYNISAPGMPAMTFAKHQPVTALKAPFQSVVEQRIYFQSDEALDQIKRLKGKLENVIRRRFEQHGSVSLDIHTDPNFSEIKEHIDNSFPWETGQYTCVLKVHVLDQNETFILKFIFALTTNEVVVLNKNKLAAKKQEEDLAILKDISSIQYNLISVFPDIKISN